VIFCQLSFALVNSAVLWEIDIVPGLVCVHQSQDVDAVLQYKQARWPLPTKIYEHGTALFFSNHDA
jgi:hypothetical protein